MKIRSFVFAAVAAATVTPALAGLSTVDPGLYTDLDDRFEARIRLDGGNSQTWKSAFWDDLTLLATSGNVQNVFSNGVTEQFSITYDALTGQASIDVAGLNVTTAIAGQAGRDLAGFRFFITSRANEGSTEVSNLVVSTNQNAGESIPGLFSELAEGFEETGIFYFTSPTTSFTMTGDITFGWLPGVNLNNERYKLSVKLIDGVLVPAPGALATALLGGFVALRRRRA